MSKDGPQRKNDELELFLVVVRRPDLHGDLPWIRVVRVYSDRRLAYEERRRMNALSREPLNIEVQHPGPRGAETVRRDLTSIVKRREELRDARWSLGTKYDVTTVRFADKQNVELIMNRAGEYLAAKGLV